MRTILHIDVNSAFLSWEAAYRRLNGEETDLRDIPSVVAGDPKKRTGVVLAKSVPAKKYGIETGEPLMSAMRKYPRLVAVPPTFGLYSRCSSALMELLSSYTDRVQQYSIDEAFMDATEVIKRLGMEPVEFANTLRERISRELGFTVNIGVSCNKLLAKAASELQKPNRTHTMYSDEIREKYWPLPVREMFGVGRRTEVKLNRIGVQTIGELAAMDLVYLRATFKSYGEVLYNHANGIDDSPVETSDEIKSIGNSTTTPSDVEDDDTAHEYLLALAEIVGERLRRKGFRAYCVGVSIRYSDFTQSQKQSVLCAPIEADLEIYEHARRLFDELWKREPVRLLGVRVTHLEDGSERQLTLWDEEPAGNARLDAVIDQLRATYGDDIIKRGSLADTSQGKIDSFKKRYNINMSMPGGVR